MKNIILLKKQNMKCSLLIFKDIIHQYIKHSLYYILFRNGKTNHWLKLEK